MIHRLKRYLSLNLVYSNVVDGLKKVYKANLLPLEEHQFFHEFHSPPLHDADFEAKPIVLLMGQYSTGKTTFIRYLLGRDFPGIRIGPEPTTDRFIAVMEGDPEGIIPGNALVADPKRPFRPLSKFGNAFLNKFQCSLLESPLLQGMSIIDTPGILSGSKQSIDRGYDFISVMQWFFERADRIILLFDAHKLDISDEFRRAIMAVLDHKEKIRIILNKADLVDHQELMKVYGALMWSLGKVFDTPEVARVYIGSFWDQPLRYDINRKLFESEEMDMFTDLQSLSLNSALRKLNDLSKRARVVKIHCLILNELYREMPALLRKKRKKQYLIDNLDGIYGRIQQKYKIYPGECPELTHMQKILTEFDFSRLHSIDSDLMEKADRFVTNDLSKLMSMISHEEIASTAIPGDIRGNIMDRHSNPFGYGKGEGADAGSDQIEWIVSKDRFKYDEIFTRLNPVEGKITSANAKEEMMKSKLPRSVLAQIWTLSDFDRDGMLDADEFALAMHLINVKLKGYDLPEQLPVHLIPPSKKIVQSSLTVQKEQQY